MSHEENTKEVIQEEMPVEEKAVEGTVVEEVPEAEDTLEIGETEKAELAEETVVEETSEVDETPAEETPVDETPAEETPADETPAEETPAEETPAEETPTEEVPAEDTSAEEEKKPRKKSGLILGIAIPCFILALLIAGYLLRANYFSDRFLSNTYVNGADVSGKTVEEVEVLLQNQVEEYVLTIYKVNGESEQIKGADIGITYNGYSRLIEAFEEQNAYEWPKTFFEERQIEAEISFDYDKGKLDDAITKLECMKAENQIEPVTAWVVYQDGTYVIREEVYGTQLIVEKVNEVIHAGVSTMAESVNLEETECYVQPKFTKDSEEIIAAQEQLNKYLTASVTYSLDSTQVKVDKELISKWAYVTDDMVPDISYTYVKEFTTGTLKSKYNTSNRAATLVSPTGKSVSMANGAVGRQVNVEAECDQLISEIKEGKTVTREPILSQRATPEGQAVWGNTYIEIDISAQHMWYIKNGTVVLETDVITGMKGSHDTPTGVYKVLEKVPGKNLRGRPLPNGQPSYITWVNYWMRLTWSGIGIHDAYWKSAFGGTYYIGGGSHGCINTPPAKAKELYGMISVGTYALIHY